MSEPFIAEVRIFAGNFAPAGWAYCDGQLLPVAQNTALFSLVGTTYGGDGQTSFGLPDLQGRAPMHPGRGPGLTNRRLGQRGGTETITLTEAQMPNHGHGMNVSTEDGNRRDPGSAYFGRGSALYADPANLGELAPQSLAGAGESQPHNNLQPYLAMPFIIALVGLYPSRS